MAADLTMPNSFQLRQDGNAYVPTGKSLIIESGGTLTAAAGSTVSITGTDTLNGNTLTAATGSATITIPNTTDTLVNLTGTQTLSGKTLTDPIITNVTRCSAQLDKTDTTLTNITGLSQTVAIGTYKFRYVLLTTCGGTGGVKVAFKYTTAVLSSIGNVAFGYTASAVASNGTNTSAADQATHIASNTANITVIGDGTMVVSTGGTVALQFAENSANSTSSVLVGSYMEFTRIA